MKTLTPEDIERVKGRDLEPGMILVDGIVREVEVGGRAVDIAFFGGNWGFVGADREVQVIGRVDDNLLGNMFGGR